ncbi:MAG: hypothetical protein M1415_05440 [Firmicutes bacterium]|nr:hypothetical protein [Bacillota bacterium]
MRHPLSRWGSVSSGIVFLSSSLLIVGMKPVSTALFPNPTRQALTVLAKTMQLPLSAPTWMPPHRGYMATQVHATTDAYQIAWYADRKPLPVNSSQILQDTTDPAMNALLNLDVHAYATTAEAHAVVARVIFVEPGGTAIPARATRVTILPHLPGYRWFNSFKHLLGGGKMGYIAWHERGWTLVTPADLPGPGTTALREGRKGKPLTTGGVLMGGLIWSAQQDVNAITANRPGSFGGVTIDPAPDGAHTEAIWQVGRLVYTLGADRGVSTALSAVGSMERYPG